MSENFAQPTVIIILIIVIMTPETGHGHESPSMVDPGVVRPFWNWSSISLDTRDMVNTTDTTCRGLALP